MPELLRPATVEEAVAALAVRSWTVLAGGTDVYPAHVERPLIGDVLDITAIEGLRGIEDRGDHWRIGALATWSDAIAAELPPLFDGLKLAAREVGGVQIQNAATLAGNLCNASPAADGVPPLLALDAEVELCSADAVGRMPLAELIRGNRRTARRPEQLVTAILVPKPAHEGMRGGFLKLGARRYLVISVVMVAGTLAVEDGKVAEARLAVGACSEVARRLPALERELAGREIGEGLGEAVAAAHLEALAPIDDVRGSAAYRRETALVLLRRLLAGLGKAP